jgi:mannose-6-phosphate isomerase-like protein (cupin superfamily)
MGVPRDLAPAEGHVMAVSGQEIVNPEIGERMRFLRTADETRGSVLETEQWLAPGGAAATRHIHPRQEERFTVVSGSLQVEIGREKRVLTPGETATIPPGAAHRFANPIGTEAHFRGEVRPALRTEELFERMAAIALRECAVPEQPLGLNVMAPLFLEYRCEVAAPGIPLGLQRIVLAVLTALARARGHAELPPLSHV